MRNKGMVMWEVIVWAIIALVVLVVLVAVFSKNFWKEGNVIGDEIGKAGDKDQDGIVDTFDACPGTQFNAPVDARGCSTAQVAEKTGSK